MNTNKFKYKVRSAMGAETDADVRWCFERCGDREGAPITWYWDEEYGSNNYLFYFEDEKIAVEFKLMFG